MAKALDETYRCNKYSLRHLVHSAYHSRAHSPRGRTPPDRSVVIAQSNGSGRSRKIGSEFEARMDDICKLVRLDVEEFLNLKPQDVNVLLLAYAKSDGNATDGFFLLGRDPVSNQGYFGHGSTKIIPASWLISYDCVWRSEHFVMHDTQSRLVKNHWGNLKMDWCRSVYSTAIMQRDFEGRCLATLTIQLRYPYLLCPRRWQHLETRLRLYKDWVNAFLGNSPAKRHNLNRITAPDSLLG
jgi:hypothetical protein